jgi:hypothetical protein
VVALAPLPNSLKASALHTLADLPATRVVTHLRLHESLFLHMLVHLGAIMALQRSWHVCTGMRLHSSLQRDTEHPSQSALHVFTPTILQDFLQTLLGVVVTGAVVVEGAHLLRHEARAAFFPLWALRQRE